MTADAMTVLALAPQYPPAQAYGLGRYATGLHRALGALGHDVRVLTLNHHGAGPTPPTGVDVSRLQQPPPLRHPDGVGDAVLANAWLAARALHVAGTVERVDLVLVHGWMAGQAASAVAEATRAPLVAVLHSTTVASAPGTLPPAQTYVAELEGWLGVCGAEVVVPSAALADEYCRVYRHVRTPIVIPPGTWQDEWRTQAHLPDFRALFARPGEPILLYAGRLARPCGPHVLLDALSILRRSRADARLVVAGHGPMATDLHKQAQERHPDHVRFTGHVSGTVLAALYHVADVLVCPHLYAPTCHAAREAAACGLPIVASHIGALAELEGVRHVPPADPAALAVAALAAIDGPRPDPVHRDWRISARQIVDLARSPTGGA